jgi:hypothetical protein
MVTKLQLTRARVNDTGHNITLTGTDPSGNPVDVEFNEENGELLLAAFASALGQLARQRTKDKDLRKVLPLDWWEILPHPAGDGLLLSFRMPGGMEMTFHLGQSAVPQYEETLSILAGKRPMPSHTGPTN